MDIASEAVLASLIWESKEWIPASWYASTEVRILGTPNLASLFFGMTSNMSVAMGISCMIMTLAILGSAYFFMSQFEFDKTSKKLFFILCLLLPNHFVILELFYLWAGYYSFHVVLMFVTLGEYARVLKKKKFEAYDIIIMGAIAILSFVMGMQGTRNILVVAGPLLVTEILRVLYCLNQRRYKAHDFGVTCWTIALLFCGFSGTCSSISVGQDISRNVRKGFAKMLDVVIPDIVRCIGLKDAAVIERVLLLICVVLLVADVLVIISKLGLKKSELRIEDWVMLYFVCSPCMTAVFISFTTIQSSERYYFMFIFAMCYSSVRTIKRLGKRHKIVYSGYFLAVGFFLLRVLSVYMPMLQHNDLEADARFKVANYLKENDYSIAYATFENANVMTVMSNGEIRVAAVASVENQDICKWLSSAQWYPPNISRADKAAYIVTEAEQEQFANFLKKHEEEITFINKIDKFLIYTADQNFTNIKD